MRPVDRWVSLRVQAGNADDVLMRRLHGPDWRTRADAPLGRRPRHLAVTAAALAAVGLAGAPAAARPRRSRPPAWLAGTAEFAWARIAPGPRTRAEVGHDGRSPARRSRPLATWHLLRGRRAAPARAAAGAGCPTWCSSTATARWCTTSPTTATPTGSRPVDGAREALDRLRARGVRVGVVSNQSGVARGLITREQVDACNARLAELLGPFDTVQVLPARPRRRLRLPQAGARAW